MNWVLQAGLTCGTYSIFSAYPEVCHGVFTRQDGVSKKPFDSLNAGFHVGDKSDCVRENRKRISAVIGGELVSVRQVHGSTVQIIKDVCDGDVEADAMITQRPGIFLTILTADCQAILLYDPVQHVVANVHSGWRGNVQNILAATLAVMQNQFACDPRQIVAGIGPSLGPCCAEFIHYETELPNSFYPYRRGKAQFDFWAISADQLTNEGILPEHIEIAGLCTVCHPNEFYSYRREHATGRFATVIGIKGT